MFGKSDDNIQIGDVSNISLPGAPIAPTPQFATPTPPAPAAIASQDLMAPELATPVIDAPATNVAGNDLSALKQQALSQLTPLVGHLDQTPEEKFRTTMMMIQAADDQSLIKTAYDAAQAITDEKAKAQALLDVINEINYFSQKQQS